MFLILLILFLIYVEDKLSALTSVSIIFELFILIFSLFLGITKTLKLFKIYS